MDSDIFYGVEEQKLFRRNLSENDDKELPNNQKDINLVRDRIVVSYKGKHSYPSWFWLGR